MEIPEPIPKHLIPLIRQLSAGDVSVLESMLREPNGCVMTVAGSANHALYTEFEKLGWVTRKDHLADLPGGSQFPSMMYSITPEGQKPLAHIAMAFLLERLTSKIIPEILTPLRKFGAKPTDALSLLSGVIVGSIINVFPAEHRGEAIDMLVAAAKRMLASGS